MTGHDGLGGGDGGGIRMNLLRGTPAVFVSLSGSKPSMGGSALDIHIPQCSVSHAAYFVLTVIDAENIARITLFKSMLKTNNVER